MISRETVERIAAEAIAAAPAPVLLSDTDATTRRAVGRAAEAAGISAETCWQRTRAAASTGAAEHAEARRVAEAARRR